MHFFWKDASSSKEVYPHKKFLLMCSRQIGGSPNQEYSEKSRNLFFQNFYFILGEIATTNPQATPLLHHMSAAHAYIQMFVTVNRTGQNDIRNILVNNWGSDLGLNVLQGLSKLYTSLVWESNILLALCSEDALPAGCEFGKIFLKENFCRDIT